MFVCLEGVDESILLQVDEQKSVTTQLKFTDALLVVGITDDTKYPSPPPPHTRMQSRLERQLEELDLEWDEVADGVESLAGRPGGVGESTTVKDVLVELLWSKVVLWFKVVRSPRRVRSFPAGMPEKEQYMRLKAMGESCDNETLRDAVFDDDFGDDDLVALVTTRAPLFYLCSRALRPVKLACSCGSCYGPHACTYHTGGVGQ